MFIKHNVLRVLPIISSFVHPSLFYVFINACFTTSNLVQKYKSDNYFIAPHTDEAYNLNTNVALFYYFP